MQNKILPLIFTSLITTSCLVASHIDELEEAFQSAGWINYPGTYTDPSDCKIIQQTLTGDSELCTLVTGSLKIEKRQR